jgi:hypothetical protein
VLDKTLLAISANFGYAGIGKVMVGYSLTSFAYNCNFDRFTKKFPSVSKLITKHTLGIYCGHRLIAFFLLNALSILFGIQKGAFYQCILIYIVGFIAFELISKLPFKWIKYVC